MNPKRNVKKVESLSFSFGVLFVLLMIIIPLITGIYTYNQSISDHTEYISDTLRHISAMLKNSYTENDSLDEFILSAGTLRNEFELSFITYITASSDNSQIKLLAEVTQPNDTADKYQKPSANYFKDVSPESTQLLSEVAEKGSLVSYSDIFEQKYGEALICYTLLPYNTDSGIICIGTDISEVKNRAFVNALIVALITAAVIAVIGSVYMRYIGKRCIMRLRRLSENIREYTRIKDPIIADNIRQIEKGNDEIAVLSQQTAAMMAEMQNHVNQIMDISSELFNANEQAEKFSKLAHIDALTELENKMAYYEAVNRLDNRIADGTAEFAFIVIDLNYLKRINDECGHNYGDTMIKKLADLIRSFFHDYSSFRIGGDEFAVIIEGNMSGRALTLSSNFQQLLNEGSSMGYKIFPSAAVGCATYRAGIDANVKEVFDRADNEMYGNKVRMKAVRKN
ncbi:MAG: diguanylate cyclase [Oscillospiraceae bacterium]|nr:diguanylate cyclase [Oscillospiraceae bacterium]